MAVALDNGPVAGISKLSFVKKVQYNIPMKRLATVMGFIFWWCAHSVFAYETDNFTCRHEKLSDVSHALNAETNRRMNEVLSKGALDFEASVASKTAAMDAIFAKQRSKTAGHSEDSADAFNPQDHMIYKPLRGCDKTELFSALRGVLASDWFGSIESWAAQQSFSKCLPDKHIYANTQSGFMLNLAGINYTINVGGVNVGVDKLSHFMSEGAAYFAKQMRGGTLDEILRIGEVEERGAYGLATTGVKSYGDLAANYQGYQFWKQITDGPDPYFKCVNNMWTQVRKLDWKEFMNPMMDESVNCSEYANAKLDGGVKKNIEALQKAKNATPITCPIDRVSCARAHEYYPDEKVRRAVVHTECLNTLSSDSEGERSHDAIVK